jgi:hypothetical protein
MTSYRNLILAGLLAAACQPLIAAASQQDAVADLEQWLRVPRESREPLESKDWASAPLTAAQARQAAALLWNDHADHIRATRSAEMTSKTLEIRHSRFARIRG